MSNNQNATSQEWVDRVDSLTPEQEAMIPVYTEKYISLGLSTKKLPQDKTHLNDLISKVYENGGRTPPKFILYSRSPLESVRMYRYIETLAILGDSRDVPDVSTDFVLNPGWEQELAEKVKLLTPDQKEELNSITRTAIDNFCYGSHDAGWVAFYDYFREVCRLKGLERIEPIKALVGEVGWYIPGNNICFVAQNPVEIHIQDGKLHNDKGAAVQYEDGFSVYAVNGERKASLMEVMFSGSKVEENESQEESALAEMVVSKFSK